MKTFNDHDGLYTFCAINNININFLIVMKTIVTEDELVPVIKCVLHIVVSYPGFWWGVRSRCLRFLNQLLTWVNVRPVFLAKFLFSSGVGYLLFL